MIAKVRGGFSVRSRHGKNLGGPYRSRSAARRRLQQIEYFKHLHHNHAGPVANAYKRQRLDPSQTTLLRRAFEKEMATRFGALRDDVVKWIDTEDELGLKERSPLNLNARTFEFTTADQRVAAFKAWLQRRIESGVLSGAKEGETAWTAKYIQSAYKQARLKSYMQVRGKDLRGRAPGFLQGSRSEFLNSAFGQGERADKVKLLYTRAFDELKGVSTAMSQKMNRILANGMIQGTGPRDIARQMTDEIDGLTRTRALVIARTEIIHAHAEGQLNAFEELGVDQVGMLAEWSTSDDDKVCPQCQEMEGKTFPVEDAHGLIPLHPNCRCAWIPYLIPDKPARR